MKSLNVLTLVCNHDTHKHSVCNCDVHGSNLNLYVRHPLPKDIQNDRLTTNLWTSVSQQRRERPAPTETLQGHKSVSVLFCSSQWQLVQQFECLTFKKLKTPLGCTASVQRNTSAPWTNQRSVVFCPIVHWSSCGTTKELCEHSVRSSPIYVLLAKQHLQVAKWEGMQHLVQIQQLHVARMF